LSSVETNATESRSVDPSELVDYCRSRMAACRYPREVEIVDAIPKTATDRKDSPPTSS